LNELYTIFHKNNPFDYVLYLCQTVTDFQNFFTDQLLFSGKFATKFHQSSHHTSV